MCSHLSEVIQSMLFKGDHPAIDIARCIDKPYSTLMRECNPFDKHAKLGADTLLKIMLITKNVEPLRFMAHELGYEVVKIEKEDF